MSRCVWDDESQSCSSSLSLHSVCITSAVSHTEQALISSQQYSCGCFEILLTLVWFEQLSVLKTDQSISCFTAFHLYHLSTHSLCWIFAFNLTRVHQLFAWNRQKPTQASIKMYFYKTEVVFFCYLHQSFTPPCFKICIKICWLTHGLCVFFSPLGSLSCRSWTAAGWTLLSASRLVTLAVTWPWTWAPTLTTTSTSERSAGPGCRPGPTSAHLSTAETVRH